MEFHSSRRRIYTMLSQNEYKKREYEMLGERRTLKFYTGWPGKLSLRT